MALSKRPSVDENHSPAASVLSRHQSRGAPVLVCGGGQAVG